MDALNARLEEIHKNKKKIDEEKGKLDSKIRRLEREEEEIERKRLELSQKMSKQDEDNLKEELTIVGKLLDSDIVIHGGLEVKSNPPSHDSGRLYTITTETSMVCRTGVNGLRAKVTIETLCPQVEAIVKSMFIQDDEDEDQSEARSSLKWKIDWDYHKFIKLVTQ